MGKCRHLVELLLSPPVEGVIMALGAFQAGSQEDADRVGHVVQGHAPVAEIVADCTIAFLPDGTTRGDKITYEMIIRLVCSDEVLDEGDVRLARLP